jgi:uncharacterized protein (DUF433 family)
MVFENLEGGLSIAEIKEQFDGTDEQIKAVLQCAPVTQIAYGAKPHGPAGIAWFVTAHPEP